MTRIAASYTFQEVENKVKPALNEFLRNDIQLLEIAAHEQAMTHRIASYLQKYFPDWQVDCEYNKIVTEKKELNGKEIRPDIIIHRRMSNISDDNLLCVEAKKIDKPIDDAQRKLHGLTDLNGTYKYRFGLLLIIGLDTPFSVTGHWYHDGELERPFELALT